MNVKLSKYTANVIMIIGLLLAAVCWVFKR